MGEYREPVQTREDVAAIRSAAARVREFRARYLEAVRRGDHNTALRLLRDVRETRVKILEKYNIVL